MNFGIALLHAPKLLILDEPTVGVDPQSRAHLLDRVRERSAIGKRLVDRAYAVNSGYRGNFWHNCFTSARTLRSTASSSGELNTRVM